METMTVIDIGLQLNAHSSRSHAILCVKLTQTHPDRTLVSTASAIDLAGSEDNRRTENNKERMVESSSINKSLFVLAQCVEAISKKQSRIPYRESKMTRILSIGQNNGLTIMILNLAPVRSYHLDTLSSLNFANRTKKIEVNEIENDPIFKGPSMKPSAALGGVMVSRQPLRQLTATQNIVPADQIRRAEKTIAKSFSVYTDTARSSTKPSANLDARTMLTAKRPLEAAFSTRPKKMIRSGEIQRAGLTKAEIEELIERRVDQKLAEKVLSQAVDPAQPLSTDLQKRLDALEQRVSEKEGSEGHQYLLMAKQHQARGEDGSALKMYQLAQPFFSQNQKLARKIEVLQSKREQGNASLSQGVDQPSTASLQRKTAPDVDDDVDEYRDEPNDDNSFVYKPKSRKTPKSRVNVLREDGPPTPRTKELLYIINTKDLSQIKLLKGVGMKKAEAIVSSLIEMDVYEDRGPVANLEQLGALKGVGWKTVENMRVGLGATVF
jgi:DNA uptake protein ComE-like DNA-binding protein